LCHDSIIDYHEVSTMHKRAQMMALTLAGSGLFGWSAAHAEAPPMKAGLWEINRLSQLINGQPMPDPSAMMAAQLKNMPPQMRQQIEAQMKAQGVQMSNIGGTSSVRMCITPDMLAQNRWQKAENGCTTASLSHSGNTWNWKVKCTQPPGEGEGATTFSSSEAYTTKMHMTTVMQGKKQVMDMTHSAKWLSANCGDVKPIGANLPKK
jgi:Protein of unknown function (DUF3617)